MELVLLTPVLVVLILLVVYAGRLTQANAKVRHAADQAARAASMVHGARAHAVAASTAIDELTADGVTCESLDVSTSRTQSAGLTSISVTVSCTVAAGDLAPLTPGRRSIAATSTEVVDVIRAVEG